MILKGQVKFNKKYKKFNIFLLLYFFFTLSAAGLLIVLFLTSHTIKTKFSKLLDYSTKAGRIEYIHIFDIAYQALKSNFYKLDKIYFDIRFDEILVLENERSNAIKNNSLGIKDRLTEVNATVRQCNKKIKAKLRLKGDRKIHFIKKKHSSYNVYLPKDNYIYGVNNFTVHKPGARNYIHEWIFNEMIGEVGLIKSKYEFFELHINGTNNGLYAFEEKMSKEIIERNKKRNGPIFSAEDEFMRPTEGLILKVYNKKFWDRPENIGTVKVARRKLSDFLAGKRDVENTFDLEKFAKFFAVLDLTYTTHALFFNSKLYYNPINGLFEPIARDGHRQLPNYHKFNINYYDKLILDSVYETETFLELGGNLQISEGRQWWIKKFFLNNKGELNQNFYDLYLKELKTISDTKFIKKFFKKRNQKIKEINSHIYSDYFFYSSSRGYTWGLYYFDKKDLLHRAEVIKKRLNTKNKLIKATINDNKILVIDLLYQYQNNKFKKAKLDNLKIESLSCYDNLNKNVMIPINRYITTNNNTKIKLPTAIYEKLNCKNVKILDITLNKQYEIEINELNSYFSFKEFKLYNKEKINKYFFESNNKLYLKINNTVIEEDLYIPKNKIVVLRGGQSLKLINDAFIFSDSAWYVNGDKNNQIIISGNNDNFGGGILIEDKVNKSIFNNVNLSYLAGFNNNIKKINSEFIILGALNFHQTKVDLSNITFKENTSEDSLNIVSSKFIMKNIKFTESKSDSIDLDFSDGSIQNAKFVNVGNDAIDFSGSNVDIKNVSFENIGDKMISAGENSKISVIGIKGISSYVGIATKDGSTVTASNIYMEKIKLPFASYNKKNEYNPASLYLDNINISEFYEKWVTDKNSKIYLNNKEVGLISKKIIPAIYKKNLNYLKSN